MRESKPAQLSLSYWKIGTISSTKPKNSTELNCKFLANYRQYQHKGIFINAAKNNLGSIIQDIVLQQTVKHNKKIPSDSILFQFDKFLYNPKEKKMKTGAEIGFDTSLLKPQFKEFVRKITLPRNVVLDYRSDKVQSETVIEKEKNRLKDILNKFCHKEKNIPMKPKKITNNDKIDILFTHLKKEDNKIYNKTFNNF
jgi:hypothetical protein